MKKIKLFIVLALLDNCDGGEDWSDIIEICTDEERAKEVVKQIESETYPHQKNLPLWNSVNYIVRDTNDRDFWKGK